MIRKMLSVFAERQALHLLIVMAGLLGSTALLAGSGIPVSGQGTSAPDPIAHDPYLVKDIITTTKGINIYDEQAMASVNGYIYLSINDGHHGYELWRSDGSEAGTVIVKDIDPDGSSRPIHLTGINDVLYFAATDEEHGSELWKSDGTVTGTVMVKDINPGKDYGVYEYYQGILVNYMDILYFTGNDGVHGDELWKSDGTAAGTVLVKDIDPNGDEGGPYSSFPRNFVSVDGNLFFAASTEYGEDLWKSDGSEAGTVLVKDISPGEYSMILELAAVGGTLYFTVDENQYGCELWKSDGTEAPGPCWSRTSIPITHPARLT